VLWPGCEVGPVLCGVCDFGGDGEAEVEVEVEWGVGCILD